ncbi:hypothetical protein SARC_16437 [Sphaeroforma arctica JP610]|uniref:Uncharacterized protein n=1 Tax=Sphaeroforma arctica JP610 TaxID=667725 RepID=A0A0L0F2T1_9EUKA|nr:hypothetical protein SARC_16437 [Sphaeroforma arctica JP610]KNC71030.1 hypothetical protein SARC_16437 [Sphaeroforma arctica JP610]|eukprot:XP_014144932.1 hypothetical protein SARC_16437 [Sphaeroforma arctica JP610]
MIGAEDIREKYLLACYQHQFDAESVSGFRNKHLMHGAYINEKNGGAHLYYLEQLVGRDAQFSVTGRRFD